MIAAGNWKMQMTRPEAADLAGALLDRLPDDPRRRVILFPPFTALTTVSAVLKGTAVSLGAQNMHYEKSGAFTGEISGPMLKEIGVTHVLIGHSERRHVFGESDELIAKKTASALDQEIAPVLCVGEQIDEREAGRTFQVVERQLREAFASIGARAIERVIIAYEPVWAIGTGMTATPEIAQEAHCFIRECVAKKYGQAPAEGTPILYGGSVKPDNVDDLMSMPDIDGTLVGGASLKVDAFARITNFA